MLSIDGYETGSCSDGYSALEELEKREYDLMITDLGMPGMSGMDLSGAAHERFPNMAIAMITGWGTQLDPGEVKAIGVTTVLSKPFHKKDIKALVRDLVQA